MGTIRLGIRGRASWWLLRWSVVAYTLRGFILDILVAEVLIFGLVDVVMLWHFEVNRGSDEVEASDGFNGYEVEDRLWESESRE